MEILAYINKAYKILKKFICGDKHTRIYNKSDTGDKVLGDVRTNNNKKIEFNIFKKNTTTIVNNTNSLAIPKYVENPDQFDLSPSNIIPDIQQIDFDPIDRRVIDVIRDINSIYGISNNELERNYKSILYFDKLDINNINYDNCLICFYSISSIFPDRDVEKFFDKLQENTNPDHPKQNFFYELTLYINEMDISLKKLYSYTQFAQRNEEQNIRIVNDYKEFKNLQVKILRVIKIVITTFNVKRD